MPTINLTDAQLNVLAGALRFALKVDENLALLAADTGFPYDSLTGPDRRAIAGLRETVDAVAKEHV
jgi:hypothetical protein